jgi:hypothetical protein
MGVIQLWSMTEITVSDQSPFANANPDTFWEVISLVTWTLKASRQCALNPSSNDRTAEKVFLVSSQDEDLTSAKFVKYPLDRHTEGFGGDWRWTLNFCLLSFHGLTLFLVFATPTFHRQSSLNAPLRRMCTQLSEVRQPRPRVP